MDWIKRNLFFLTFGAIAVILLGLSGWYLWSKYQLNNAKWDSLNQDYSELATLNSQNPHPGAGQIDNVKLAKAQQEEVKGLIEKVRTKFERTPPIPDLPQITDRDFSAALSRTIDRLRRDATNSSVIVPANYAFSFEAQRGRLTFASGTLEAVAGQLGEVSAICDILFNAKVNSIQSIKRERVSTDDNSGQLSDYVDKKPVTNELAVVHHYEAMIRCFTPELAAVLAGFANSPNGLTLKGINVKPAEVAAPTEVTPVTPVYTQVIQQPSATEEQRNAASAAAAFRRRYGVNRGGGAATPTPQPQQPTVVYATPGASKGGLQTVLDEKQLDITLSIVALQLISDKPTAEPAAPTTPQPETQAVTQ